MATLNIVQDGKLQLPQLRRDLDLGEFHGDLAGNVVNVWLNPSVDWYSGVSENKDPVEFAALMAQLWNCTTEEAKAIIDAPGLGTWLINRAMEMVNEYREGRLKNAATAS